MAFPHGTANPTLIAQLVSDAFSVRQEEQKKYYLIRQTQDKGIWVFQKMVGLTELLSVCEHRG